MTIELRLYTGNIDYGLELEQRKEEAERFYNTAQEYLAVSETACRVFELLNSSHRLTRVLIDLREEDVNELLYTEKCTSLRKCKKNFSEVFGQGQPASRVIFDHCQSMGCAVWAPLKNSRVIEKETSRTGWHRPASSHPWSEFLGDSSLCSNFRDEFDIRGEYYSQRAYRSSNEEAVIPAPVLLIHELGHAFQYICDPVHFDRFMKKPDRSVSNIFNRNENKLDTLVMAGVEHKVCIFIDGGPVST